jgi:hypothetical protein
MVTVLVSLSSQDKDEQTQLEMKHRKEEDDLYRKFARQREEEDKRMREEFRVSAAINLIGSQLLRAGLSMLHSWKYSLLQDT